ncbi:MAG TPA: hypothetical protein VF086_19700 [Propionibacteriaceae bacterium]
MESGRGSVGVVFIELGGAARSRLWGLGYLEVQQRAVVVGHPGREVGDRANADRGIRDDEPLT